MKSYYTYILASKKNGTIYIGFTSNLKKRVWEHKNDLVVGFTKVYEVHDLVYFEEYTSPEEAIVREKYLKGKNRKYKLELIEDSNPDWKDIYCDI